MTYKVNPDFGAQPVTTSGNISTTGSGTLTIAGDGYFNGTGTSLTTLHDGYIGGNITVNGLGSGVVHSSASGAFTSSTIVNADVSSSAAIAVSKLASGTSAQILLNNSTPTPTWTTISGDSTISATGAITNIALRGQTISATAATNDGYVLTYNLSNNDLEWTATTGTVTNKYWSQASWFIDPTNGFDGYDGTSQTFTSGTTGPIKTWAELVRRWGTSSPNMRQNTTITFVNSQTDNTDPVSFSPIIANQAVIVLTGVLGASQQVATGTLGTVTAKNKSTPQLLNAVLTSGLSVGQLIVNSTHPSRAWLYKNVSGNTWAISQPLTTANTAAWSQPTEVDTWTVTTDTYTVYNPVQVNIVKLAPMLQDINSTTFANNLQINSLVILDPNAGAFNSDVLTIGPTASLTISECSIQRYIQMSTTDSILSVNFSNVDFASGCIGGGLSNIFQIFGGQIRSLIIPGLVKIDLDTIMGASCNFTSLTYGSIYIDTSKTLTMDGVGSITTATGTHTLWGPGNLSILGRTQFRYSSTAVSTFLLTGTITLNGVSTASAFNPTGIGIFASGISITAANIDATISSGGFGGTAMIPGGASITNNANQTAFGTLSFLKTITTPTFSQAAQTTDTATNALTIQSQNALSTATTNILGAVLNIQSGTGGNSSAVQNSGLINIKSGADTIQTFDGYGMHFSQTSGISLAVGTTTLSAAQLKTPLLLFTGTPGAGTVTIDFGAHVGTWYLDFSGVTLGATVYTLKNGAGTNTVTTLLVTKTLLIVIGATTATINAG